MKSNKGRSGHVTSGDLELSSYDSSKSQDCHFSCINWFYPIYSKTMT